MNKLLLVLVAAVTIVCIPFVAASKNDDRKTLVLSAGNLLVLNNEVNGDSVGPLIAKAKKLDDDLAHGLSGDHTTPIYLYLNTPGGSVQSGLELVEALKGLGRPVHTISAFSASMGFQVVQQLDTRYILQSGILMSHRAAGQFDGSFGGSSPSPLDQRIHLFVQITREMDEQTVRRTNGKQTLESYQKSYAPELWMTGRESIAAGYADALAYVKCDKSLSGNTKHQADFMGMSITYELSDCPINTAPANVRIGMVPGLSNEYAEIVKNKFTLSREWKASNALPMAF